MEKLRDNQILYILTILRIDIECSNLVPYFPRQRGRERIVLNAFSGIIIRFARLSCVLQHIVSFRGSFGGFFLFLAPFKLLADSFTIHIVKSVCIVCVGRMRHFCLRNFNLRCGLRCRGRNGRGRQAIILVAEARAIQTANNAAYCIVKIVRGSQHIGHIQRRLCVLCGVRQTEYAP